jgi:hypothetical protein
MVVRIPHTLRMNPGKENPGQGLKRWYFGSNRGSTKLAEIGVTDEIHVHPVNHDHSDNRRQNLHVVHRTCHQIASLAIRSLTFLSTRSRMSWKLSRTVLK